MTNFLLFFLLFVYYYVGGEKTSIADFRERSAVKAHDIIGLVEKSMDFEDFRVTNNLDFLVGSISINGPSNVMDNFLEVSAELNIMNKLFLRACYSYVEQHIGKYCESAVHIMDNVNNVTEDFIRASIGFAEELDEYIYCMLTAFYEVHVDRDDRLFEGFYFFLTIDRESVFTEIETRLRSGCRLFAYEKQSARISPRKSHSKLKVIKRKISDFSKMFCTAWRPFLRRPLIKNRRLDDVQNESFFIFHVFHDEKCVIGYKQFRVKNRVMHKITSWDCDNIVEPKEEKSTKKQQLMIREISSADRSHTKIRFSRVVLGKHEVSLGSLKKKLKLHTFSYYLNVVQFYNIASDVLLLASVNEGNTILKGIKQVVVRSCMNVVEISVNLLDKMKSTLSTFKGVFDELVSVILRKKRIRVTDNPHKTKFDRRVDEIMRMLNVQDNQISQAMDICSQIPFDINADSNGSPILFVENFFTRPLVNINQLYDYVANRF